MSALFPLEPSPHRPTQPKELPFHTLSGLRQPQHYLADPGLVDAVNVALMLRQPLMLTGEPGTGKTVLAWSLAWELGLEPPFVFETKSTSQARDLFYVYDTLGRFAAKELRADAGQAKDYINYSGLGAAIVLTNSPDAVADILPEGFSHRQKRRSVVLIDEVEKAPRDFPNDILNEIERMYFRIPELGNRRVEADEEFSPIVVMTNNSERSLPDAFLRRCIYYNIPFPNAERLTDIVIARLPEFAASAPNVALSHDAIDFLLYIRRDSVNLDKRPGTAELLNWLSAIMKLGGKANAPLNQQLGLASRAAVALAKTSGDQARIGDLLRSWNGPSGT
ncbi:MAG: MoxR family ATPase [Pseudomonadota bacterium]|jgi:MoxR-like ATPase